MNCDDGNHEYDIFIEEIDKGTVYNLLASNNAIWSEHIRGKLFLSIVDDGNGLLCNKSLKAIDYGEAVRLKILINFIFSMDTNMGNKFKIVEEIVINEV